LISAPISSIRHHLTIARKDHPTNQKSAYQFKINAIECHIRVGFKMVKPTVKDQKKPTIVERCCVPPDTISCRHPGEPELNIESGMRMKCSNAKCTIIALAHKDCFRVLEEELLKLLERVHVRANVSKWKDHQRETMLWSKCYDLIYKHCR
jgi:hypothetical protein